ncbi:hypothetical protein ZEAMMB73_Zm00001d012360 [Zea mays]|uniref:Uncharacterized protein n=1 Tax=Zea mays TaxID=4577 RepID=A0A1D6G8A5_MAIZE|nr:hypothetical protein ZEAMMB73_Zm00001d012360 [Zea mays]
MARVQDRTKHFKEVAMLSHGYTESVFFPKKQINHVAPEPLSEIAEEHDGLERVLVPMQGIVDNGKSTSELLTGSVSLRSAEVARSPVGRTVKCEEFLNRTCYGM